MTTSYPSAPPLRSTAPTSSTAPATAASPTPLPHPLDINGVAAAIAAADDPAALLTHLLLSVSARTATAPEQGVLLSKVSDGCADMLRRVRAALLASVDQTPGAYAGFEVISRGGSRRVNYDRLQKDYPDAYDEVVTTGSPTMVVRYTNPD